LITSPAFIVMKAADEFQDKTTAPNQFWQTDFTYFKVTGWGWFYLSTVLDDFARFIIAWKHCTTMKASDVTDTLDMALEASGCDNAKVVHKPRLLSDNGSSYISGELATWFSDKGMDHTRGAPMHPQTQGKIERASDAQEPHPDGACFTARRPLNIKPQMCQSLHSFRLQSVPIYLTTDTLTPTHRHPSCAGTMQ
jgi:transposase InsO family protein